MRRSQRGGVFIITLGVLIALMMVLTAAVTSQRQAMRAEINRLDHREAEMAAMAGVQRAIATLATQPQSPTTQNDPWFTLGTNGDERFTDGATIFRLQVIDAGSLININTAPLAQLQKLPLSQEQIDCLLDFREASRTPRADGAKDEYYSSLQNPYNAKELPFDSVDELLQVKGFTPDILYLPPTNQVNTAAPLVAESNGITPVLADLLTVDSTSQPMSAAGAALPNIATANIAAIQRAVGNQTVATQIFQRRGTFTTWAQVLAVPGITTTTARALVNAFRVGGATAQQGKINLNTATDNVLNSIPNMSSDVVSAIISRQGTGFTQLGDVFDIPGYSIQLARQTIDRFSVDSNVFIIRVVGLAGSTQVPLQVTVSIAANQPPKIIRIEHPPQPDVATSRWGWQQNTQSDTDLKGGL